MKYLILIAVAIVFCVLSNVQADTVRSVSREKTCSGATARARAVTRYGKAPRSCSGVSARMRSKSVERSCSGG